MEEYILEILQNALEALGVTHSHIDIEQEENSKGEEDYYCDIQTREASLLIGKGGNNIAALEHLIKLILIKRFDKTIHITLDADSYKKRQKENAIGVAERHISKLMETKKDQSLPPMQAVYRRAVHMHIADKYPEIQTDSHGYGKFRHIKISLK
jgi:spoIIIJ-associated protein